MHSDIFQRAALARNRQQTLGEFQLGIMKDEERRQAERERMERLANARAERATVLPEEEREGR